MGDLITSNIWSDKSKKVLQRSAVRTADPTQDAIPNLRVVFEEDEEDKEPELVDPDNVLDAQDLLVPPPKHCLSQPRTRKHKVKWHDTHEPPPEDLSHFKDSLETIPEEEGEHGDFKPTITPDDLDQSDPCHRHKVRQTLQGTLTSY